jgi:uroporphyrinogen III methyltransferase / synthase
MVTFTSSSTVKNFKALIPDNMFSSLLNGVTIACIGPITADTAKELGFNVQVMADEFTIPGLCKAIVQHYISM